MYRLENQNKIRIYKTDGRDLTVVRGQSSVLYPFYRSSGLNTFCGETWFPWMGYFDFHPESRSGHEIYMVKPQKGVLSDGLVKLLKKHLTHEEFNNILIRMGNDEALALSCCLGGGIWTSKKLSREIINSSLIENYLKILLVQMVVRVEINYEDENCKLALFQGKKYSGLVQVNMATIAEKMERITSKEIGKQRSKTTYSIQDKQQFPTNKELEKMRTDQLSMPPCSAHENYTGLLDDHSETDQGSRINSPGIGKV